VEGRAPTWVQWGLVALAVPQLVTGTWAVLAPRSWYRSFPGVDPRLVAADPPFNEHLATDAGAGFLATAVALLAAAAWGSRGGTAVALLAYLAFALPHLAFHVANPAPGLSATEDIVNGVALAAGVALAGLLLWRVRPRRTIP
jgi:hypothetical protein